MKPFPRSGLPGVQPPVGPSETTTSIGHRCKRGDALSRVVLIAREAFHLFQRFSSRPREQPGPAWSFSREGHTRSHSEHGSQASLRRWYLAPGPGRVGRRWIHAPHEVNLVGGFFYTREPPEKHRGTRGFQCPSSSNYYFISDVACSCKNSVCRSPCACM